MAMLRVMTWISLRLGRPVARGVLFGITLYFLFLAPVARRASRAYLRRALGQVPRLRELFWHFHTFATCIHDRVYLLNDRLALFDIQVHGAAALEAVLAAGRGAFLLGAHMGSFEVIRAVGRQRLGLRVAMVMYENNAIKINAALAAINPASVQDIIPLGQLDSMLQVRARLDEGMVLGMLGDRTLDDDPTLSVQFLGSSAAFPVGPMRLAAILGRPVFFMTGLHLGGNRYAIHFEPLADFTGIERTGRDAAIREAVAAYAASLARHCRGAPYNWFNFFDFWRAPAGGGRA
ncbi:acyl-CoA synthetase [uncultured Thiodictyon sp.]|uniref:LpxL/LpxP family acyltransferase n=1 Tax=uncultured Thiodictyon sp. TaxID=1846217 RepID=UPI0025D69F8F|nr:acyl-CoA synthetase [uncultured Thiodictyon sp.]